MPDWGEATQIDLQLRKLRNNYWRTFWRSLAEIKPKERSKHAFLLNFHCYVSSNAFIFFNKPAQSNSAKMHIQQPKMHLNLCKQTIWSHSHLKGCCTLFQWHLLKNYCLFGPTWQNVRMKLTFTCYFSLYVCFLVGADMWFVFIFCTVILWPAYVLFWIKFQ